MVGTRDDVVYNRHKWPSKMRIDWLLVAIPYKDYYARLYNRFSSLIQKWHYRFLLSFGGRRPAAYSNSLFAVRTYRI